jgi:hypothetical protein
MPHCVLAFALMAGKPRHGAAVSEPVSARLLPSERAALDQLLARRASEMEARNEPGDASFAGWLRSMIRREARAAGIVIETSAPSAPEPAKRTTKTKKAR